jgi:polyisoprenoid-binding protein YceI
VTVQAGDTSGAPRPVGPGDGSLAVRTFRAGIAATVGHDLTLLVTSWEARIELDVDRLPARIELDVDPASLRISEASGGSKPLSDRDRDAIEARIKREILRGEPIAFRSDAIEGSADRLSVSGELTIAGRSRPLRAELERSPEGRLSGTVPLLQSDWGIKPYAALLGALRVDDRIEVVIVAAGGPA